MTSEDTAGTMDNVWTSAMIVGRVRARVKFTGRTHHAPTIWEEISMKSQGHEDERGSGEIISKTKMNISHDLRIRNLVPIADSEANLNFLCMNSPSDYNKLIEPIRALLPDGNKINVHIQCQIKMYGIPEHLKTAYKFDNIQEPLMSIPVMCDNICIVTFTKQSVHVNKDGKTILTSYIPNCGGLH